MATMLTHNYPGDYAIYCATDTATGAVLSYPVFDHNPEHRSHYHVVRSHPTKSFTLLVEGLHWTFAAAIATRMMYPIRKGRPPITLETAMSSAIVYMDKRVAAAALNGGYLRLPSLPTAGRTAIAERRKGGITVRRREATFTPDAV